MKKYSFVLVLLLAVNILYAQNAYQSVLDQIETNSTVLSSVTKQYDAMKAANNARSFVENPELEGAYKWGVGEAGNGMELNLVQEIEFPTVYSNKKKIRKINNTIIDAELEMQHYEIMYQVQQLCLDLIYNKKMLDFYQQCLDNAENIADGFNKSLEAGEVNVLDYNKAQINLMNCKTALSQTRIERKYILGELKTLNGGKDISFTYEDYDNVVLPSDFGQWYSTVQANNPSFVYLRLNNEADKQNVKLCRSEWIPKFKVGYAYENEDGNSFNGVVVGLSLPSWHNKKTVQQAKTQAEASESMIINNNNSMYNSLFTLYQQAVMLQENLQNISYIVKQYDSQELLKKSFDAGEMSLVEYLLEVEYYQNAMKEYFATEYDYQKTMINLKSHLFNF